ncbi:sporulation protein [Paenibacillus sp. JX-17]|uniref:Sporulation protein n=1 Tax=Paenibacillus lacisoli TaxID=3064525 RepID=A0ABT9CF59_9BACL|nr:sporulation protein [Paenibacillus sp. JX-17]MDO7907911.1 sporulation protein [Paenibacillus sp. JX-17]
MSFFNKMLASFGIGAARIDTLLDKPSYHPGEDVHGVIHIYGGSTEQQVDRIYVQVMTEYILEHDDRKVIETCCMARITVSDRLTVQAGEKLEIPFAFPLPLETPLTLSRQPVWLRTGLDIDNAFDPKDQDYIEVVPHPDQTAVLEAVEQLGFTYRSSTCEYHKRLGRGVPFVQEIEFYPGGRFAGRMTELELIVRLEHDGLSVLVEVDRRGSGLGGWLERAFDMDERHAWIQLNDGDLRRGTGHIAQLLESQIERMSR